MQGDPSELEFTGIPSSSCLLVGRQELPGIPVDFYLSRETMYAMIGSISIQVIR